MGLAATITPGIHKILIRTPNWIGDAVMATPAMGAVRSSFPNAHLTVAANPAVAELFRYHPYCDKVMVFDKKGAHRGIGGLLRFCIELRKEGFDLAILLQNAMEAAIIAFAAGIPFRAGYRTDGRRLLLTHGVALGKAARRLHHTAYYLRMLDMLGIRGGDGQLRLQCTQAEQSWAHQILGDGRWVAINPGASYGSAKRWMPQRFAAVADRLAERYPVRIVLTGTATEAAIGREIEQAMRHKSLNLIGQTALRQLLALLANCSLLITNDSGPMHIAAAFHIPIVAIFGSTDHITTSPLTPNYRIVRKDLDCAPCLLRQCPTDHRCMEAIEVEEVLEAAARLLGGTG